MTDPDLKQLAAEVRRIPPSLRSALEERMILALEAHACATAELVAALRRVDAEADHASDCQVWGEPGTATQDEGCSCYIEAVNAAMARCGEKP